MPKQLSILIASLPDREAVVAELWYGETQFAELAQEGGVLALEIYAPPSGNAWALSYEDTLDSLQQARAKLLG